MSVPFRDYDPARRHLHNPRHSGESRNPEGQGNGERRTNSVIADPFGMLCKGPAGRERL